MAEGITKTQALSRLESYKNRMAKVRDEARVVTKRTVSTALGTGAGFGVGYVRANYGEVKVPGTTVDADLTVGLAAAVLGITGLAGDQSDHAASIGTGVLAGYAALHAANK